MWTDMHCGTCLYTSIYNVSCSHYKLFKYCKLDIFTFSILFINKHFSTKLSSFTTNRTIEVMPLT